jgi:hypothetical protein
MLAGASVLDRDRGPRTAAQQGHPPPGRTRQRAFGSPLDACLGPSAHLGDAHHASADARGARQAGLQALAILEDLQHPDATSGLPIETQSVSLGMRQTYGRVWA